MSDNARDFTRSARRRLEGYLNDCRDNGMQGRNLYRELRGEIIDIVPDVAQDFDDIDNYYGEVNRCIVGLLSDISRVYSQAYATETDFVIALDREVRRARYLLQALKGLNRLVDPRPISGGRSLMQLSPQRFNYHAAKIEVALAGKAFESMVIRDGDTIIGYRWDIIENILSKDYLNISETQFAALTRVLVSISNPADIERFMNLLAVPIDDIRTLFPGKAVNLNDVPEGMIPFNFCQDKLAALQRHLGATYDRALLEGRYSLLENILQRYALFEAIAVAMSGEQVPSVLWGGADGPISIQGTPYRNGTEFILSITSSSALPTSADASGNTLVISLTDHDKRISPVHTGGSLYAYISVQADKGAEIRYQFCLGTHTGREAAERAAIAGATRINPLVGVGVDGALFVDGVAEARAEARDGLQASRDVTDAKAGAIFNQHLNMNTVTVSDGQGGVTAVGRPSSSTQVDGVGNLNHVLSVDHGSDRQTSWTEIRDNPSSIQEYFLDIHRSPNR